VRGDNYMGEGFEGLNEFITIIAIYLIGACFLIVYGFITKKKKEKIFIFSIFALWLMSPFFIYLFSNLDNYTREVKLEKTYPSEELVRESFSHRDNEYVSLTNVTFDNGVLRLRIDIDEKSLKKALINLRQKAMEDEEYAKVHFTSEEKKEKILIELSHHHIFKEIYYTHDIRWDLTSKTTMPTNIITEVYYKGELFQSIGNMANAVSMEKSKELYHALLSEE
jgi:hypothetical protein